jgi:DNA polymerase III alpha subunit
VREIELEIEQIKQRSKQSESEAVQRRMQSEWRMKQLESEIEQLRRENAKGRALSALIKQHCFPPECSSTPPQATEPDCGPFSA